MNYDDDIRSASLGNSRGARFSVQLTAFRQRAMANIDRVRRGVALRLFKAIIMDSPVLTGRLRANWLCSINVPERGGATTVDKNGGLVINAMAKTVAESEITDALILTNSLPYVKRIEYDGWSHTKAPKGMVRINVLRFQRLLGEELRVTHTQS